jgi:glycosyltransferase involved in cell wall biosynthesis
MVTWLERQLLPGQCTAEGWLRRPLVFDVDDAIWLLPPAGADAAKRTAERAAVVIAGNAYIADWFSAFSREVRIVPTAVDTERFCPRHGGDPDREGTFVVGWTGTSSNLAYLEAIKAPLRRFLADHADSLLLVMSDRPPRFADLDAARIRYERWTVAGEVQAIRRMDVGLMPLPDNEWTRGKCSFKMLLYMACGIPVVASPVGMNREILEKCEAGLASATEDDWYEALASLHADRSQADRLGKIGRALVEREFSQVVITERLAGIFRGVA